MRELPIGMRRCPECNSDGMVTTMGGDPDLTESTRECVFPGCAAGKGVVPVENAVWTEPIQLTQVRQWETGTLHSAHETFSFGHGWGVALVEAVEQLHALVPQHDDDVVTPGVSFEVEWHHSDSTFVHTCRGFETRPAADDYAAQLPRGCLDVAICRVERQTVR